MFRMHDPRVGRFFSVDPLSPEYPWYSPYQFAGNKVIAFRELEGAEEMIATQIEQGKGVSISTITGEKIAVKMLLSDMTSVGAGKAKELSYALAFEKLGQGYLMADNNKIYGPFGTKLVEDIVDGTTVRYHASSWTAYHTNTVDQISAFKGKGWLKISHKLATFSEVAGPFVDTVIFMGQSAKEEEVSMGGLSTIGLGAGVNGIIGGGSMGNIAAALAMYTNSIVMQTMKDRVDETNAYLVNYLEKNAVSKGLDYTKMWVDFQEERWAIIENYSVMELTTEAMGLYINGIVTDYTELTTINDEVIDRYYTNGIEPEIGGGLLLYESESSPIIVRHIFINDADAKPLEKE